MFLITTSVTVTTCEQKISNPAAGAPSRNCRVIFSYLHVSDVRGSVHEIEIKYASVVRSTNGLKINNERRKRYEMK